MINDRSLNKRIQKLEKDKELLLSEYAKEQYHFKQVERNPLIKRMRKRLKP